MVYGKNGRKRSRYSRAPARRTKRRRTRATRRRTTSAVTRTGFGGSTTPFGRAFSTKLKFAIRIAITPGVNAYDNSTVSANNLVDPALAEGTKQPAGFDQLAALYAQYRVYGAKLKATFMNTSTTVPCAVFLKPGTLATPVVYSTIDEAIAAPGTTWKTVPVAGAQSTPTVLSRYVSIANAYGVNKSVVQNDDLFAALIGSAPDHLVNFNLTTISVDETAVPVGSWIVAITYYVKFFDPFQIALSAA